jgi:hypothetical protein
LAGAKKDKRYELRRFFPGEQPPELICRADSQRQAINLAWERARQLAETKGIPGVRGSATIKIYDKVNEIYIFYLTTTFDKIKFEDVINTDDKTD